MDLLAVQDVGSLLDTVSAYACVHSSNVMRTWGTTGICRMGMDVLVLALLRRQISTLSGGRLADTAHLIAVLRAEGTVFASLVCHGRRTTF